MLVNLLLCIISAEAARLSASEGWKRQVFAEGEAVITGPNGFRLLSASQALLEQQDN
jgi:hypothetical protein